jgi:hypothetical protein
LCRARTRLYRLPIRRQTILDATRPPYRIDTEYPERILDALKRAACAQGLLLSGFFDLARRVLLESSETRGSIRRLTSFP